MNALTEVITTCSIEGCDKPIKGRGWCRTHYQRWFRHGDPLTNTSPRGQTPAEQLWPRVDKSAGPDGCWPWTGPRTSQGYGTRLTLSVSVTGGRRISPHRLAYELEVGEIPEGLQLDHLCRNPPCCNPAHLEPVTGKENSLRGFSPAAQNARKTHCKRGHEFTPENTITTSEGRRRCRACTNRRPS